MRRVAVPLAYAALALLVAGPLLGPGYVFSLDHAMGPRSAAYYAGYLGHNEDAIQSKGGYALLLLALGAAFPMWVAQKLLLFAPFFLAGWGAHRLAARHASLPAAFFGGLLYALSPFAYVRGVAGQTGVLWAYALAPWFFAAWLAYVDARRARDLTVAALLVAATGVFQAHGVALLALLVGLHTLVRLARAPRAWLATLRAPAALAFWSLLLNAAWLVPLALAPRTTLAGIGAADRAFFATSAAGLPSVGLAALALLGFWRESWLPAYPSPWLLVAPALVLLLAVRGAQRRDEAGLALALAGLVGLVAAVASGSDSLGAVWDRVPLLRGFRDAHKLLALLALAYADLAPSGLDALVVSLRASRVRLAAPALLAVALVVPLAGATPLLGGYGGQLRLAEYPDGWAEVERATSGCQGAMLVLPWHLYLDLSWVHQRDARVTNPAKVYFSCPTLTSDDLELGNATSQASTPVIQYADRWMDELARGNPHGIRALGNLLAPAGVEYVLVLKESDWRDAAREMDNQTDLRVALENANARLYRNAAYVAPGGLVERVVPIRSWDDLLPLASNVSFGRTAFPMGEERAAGNGTPLALVTPGPRTPDASWRAGGSPPRFLSLGFAPAFPAQDAPQAVDVTAQRVAPASWAVSVAAFVLLVAWSSGAVRHLKPKAR